MACLENADEPGPPAQACGQADAAGDRQGQREKVIRPRPDRARIRASEEPLRRSPLCSHQWRINGSLIRTIGLVRAEAKLTLANIACNFDRLVFHERRGVMG